MIFKTGCFALSVILMMPSIVSARPGDSGLILQIRGDAVPIDPARAKAMTPDELGAAILAPGHPPVDEAVVGPLEMQPPAPPTMPIATPITLFLHPVANDPAGFCRRTEVQLNLKLAGRTPDGGVLPTLPESLTTRQAFRWVGDSGSEAACAVPRYEWFIPRAGEEAQALSLVRLVASLQHQAATGARLRFQLKVADKMGREMAASERKRPGQHWNTPPIVFSDGRAALAALPLGKIGYVGPSSGICCDPLPFKWSATMGGRSLTASTLELDLVWRVTLQFDGSRLVRVGVVRAAPLPF